MLKTVTELLSDLGEAVRARRVAQNWSQNEAAKRAGMSRSTWKRLEATGQATTENLVNAAISLRCEDGFAQLFPAALPQTMDELLEQQRKNAPVPKRQRTSRKADKS
jgi:transcriptional regulator with XRE-family HTH domain